MFDPTGPLRRLDGDRDLLCMLIAVFHTDSIQLLRQLDDGLRQSDARLVERSAHSLKGLTSNFDAFDAQQAAARIEGIARGGALQEIQPLLGDLRLQLDALSQSLRRWESTVA